jgi:hypothetical protein
MKEAMMNCPSCGALNPDNNVYCGNCGSKLSPAESSPSIPGQTYFNQQPSVPPQHHAGYYPPPGTYYPARPLKDRNIALILEILPGLFGFLGFGWIYSGNTSTGIAWLVGYLFWILIAAVVIVATGGFAVFCTLPINLIFIGVSASSLNNYTKQNPQMFGP